MRKILLIFLIFSVFIISAAGALAKPDVKDNKTERNNNIFYIFEQEIKNNIEKQINTTEKENKEQNNSADNKKTEKSKKSTITNKNNSKEEITSADNVEKPFKAIKEIKKEDPAFGNKPWEKTAEQTMNNYSASVEKECEKAQKKYDTKKKIEDSLVDMPVPQIDDYKTWMSYTSVTSVSSPQYQLLNSDKAYTDEKNFRKIGKYYCVALGSFYSTEIGTKFKITFDDGKSIDVILGDQKSDRHTDSKHQYSSSGNILEFIMGSKEYSNQATINTLFPAGVKKIQLYSDEFPASKVHEF